MNQINLSTMSITTSIDVPLPANKHRRLPVCFAILLASALAVPSAAQSGADVTGVVTDSADVALSGATVVLLQAADSVIVTFGITNADGAFLLRAVPAGEYLLQVNYVGYALHTEPLSVDGAPVDVRPLRLFTETADIGEIVVLAERIPVVFRSDTLVYDADAFRTPLNATVAELLRRLPGVEVDRDGTITAQGETVRNILVDGKEFIGNDPTIATQNLPANAVDAVEVFDRLSDMSEFTGFDDGQGERTINLVLNAESREAYLGNLSGGVGTGTALDVGPRYDGTVSVHRFSSGTQVSAIGNFNNVNRQGFDAGEFIRFIGGMEALRRAGGPSGLSGAVPVGASLSDGFTTTLSGGINFNHDFSQRTLLRSSYFFNGIETEQDRSVLQQQLSGSTRTSLGMQQSDQTGQHLNHRLDLNIDHEISDGHDIRLRSDISLSDQAMDQVGVRETRTDDGIPANSSATTYDSEHDALDAHAALTYRKRFAGRRSIVAGVESDLSDSDLTADLLAVNEFYRTGNLLTREELDQFQSVAGRTLTHAERLSYIEPLGAREYLQLELIHREVRADEARSVFDREAGGLVRSDSLSSAIDRAYLYDTAGMNFLSDRENVSVGVGLDLQKARLGGELPGAGITIDRDFVHLLPSASLQKPMDNGTLGIRYSASTREPSLRDLQPVADNRDPLNVFVGNPDLRPAYAHSARLQFAHFDPFSFTVLHGFLRATYTLNDITRSRTIDEQLRQTQRPVNVDGTWSLAGNLNFDTPIRPLGSKIILSTNTVYDHGIEFINEEENATKVLRSTLDASVENRNKDRFDLMVGASYTFNSVAYSLNAELERKYVNRTYYGQIAYNWRDAWRFATSLDYRVFSPEVFGSGQHIPLWEVEASRTILNNRIQVQLLARDLLDLNAGVNYSNTNAYVELERISGLGRYVMMKVIYSLSGTAGQGGRGRVQGIGG